MAGSFSLLFTFAFIGATQTPKSPSQSSPPSRQAPPEIRAARLTGTITIDGDLNEPDWSKAQPATGCT
ncbi:MAG TPA: hypothetical protein VFD73_26185, partial [Gemmatimonadales bacterium]|nr:hypothetical protein [Gemmatimonadales bacterium]